jgi:Arc/MetJ-type ribon-helix-helix transcriptional regulator
MKLSVSLPDEDVEFLDQYAASQGISSRSAAVHEAVRLLRAAELGPSYEDAWAEWTTSDDRELWDATTGDGLS